MEIHVPSIRQGYSQILQTILGEGRICYPRGMRTAELVGTTIRVDDPTDSLCIGVGRGLRASIAAAEAVQLIGGFSDPHMMCQISDEFRQFLNGDSFHGAYGPRVENQLMHVARKIMYDADTRQAIVQLWDKRLDNMPDRNDFPCTLMLHFLLRDDKLQLHTYMRSADAWLGLPYDVFQFTQLQLTMARAMDANVGAYYHHVTSLHLYDRDIGRVDYVGPPNEPCYGPMGFGRGPATIHSPYDAIRRARFIGIGRWNEVPMLTTSEQWYVDKLRPYVKEVDV